MALTKVGKEGVVGLDNSADATAITISSGEVVTLSNNLITNGNILRGDNDSSNTLGGGTASNSGGNIAAYGSSHSSLASNIRFRSGSTVTMLMDSTGAMTKPLQPCFHAISNAHQTISSLNTAVTINFATERFDQNSDFDNTNMVFTAPVTGKYLLTTSLYLFNSLDSAATYYYMDLVTSNETIDVYFATNTILNSDTNGFNFQASGIMDMDASDTAKVRMYQSGGSAQTQVASGVSHFTGALIC
tara:strand:+ start:51 stop:785 length:735 start_codon:yes stop_codon:yes gene_type:complete